MNSTLDDKPLVVQHCFGSLGLGGPMTGVRVLMASPLASRYRFDTVFQDRPAGGINLPLMLRMANRIRSLRPDILHVRGLQNEGFHGVMAGRLAGVRRIVLSVHGFIGDTLSHPSPWKVRVVRDLLEPFTVRSADGVYCVCAHGAARPVVLRNARRHFGYIHNGVPTYDPPEPDIALRQSFGFSAEDVVGICVSRVTREKGLLDLCEAVRILIVSGRRAPKILMVGDGPDADLVRQKAALLPPGQIVLAGRRSDAPALLALSDFFVMPTLHENLSFAILEAMNAKRAVVSTAVGGNPEVVVDGETGVLVPPANPFVLADALHALTADGKMRTRMGLAGRARVEEHFSVSVMTKRLDAVYQEVLRS